MEKITMKSFRSEIDGKKLSLIDAGFPKDMEAALSKLQASIESGRVYEPINTGTVHLTSAGFYRVRIDNGERSYWSAESGGSAVYRAEYYYILCSGGTSMILYRLERGE